MTVIAYDGTQIAADSLVIFGNWERGMIPSQKMCVAGPGRTIYAAAGPSGMLPHLVKWFQDRHEPEHAPKATADNPWSLLVIQQGQPALYFHWGQPVAIAVGAPFAFGAAADFALGVMHKGGTAEEAVRLACGVMACVGPPVVAYDISETLAGVALAAAE